MLAQLGGGDVHVSQRELGERLVRVLVSGERIHERVPARDALHQVRQLVGVGDAVVLSGHLSGVREQSAAVPQHFVLGEAELAQLPDLGHGHVARLLPPRLVGHQVERAHGAALAGAIELVELDEVERRVLAAGIDIQPNLQRRQNDPPGQTPLEIIERNNRLDLPLREHVERETLQQLVPVDVRANQRAGTSHDLRQVVQIQIIHLVNLLQVHVVVTGGAVPGMRVDRAALPPLRPRVPRRRVMPALATLDRLNEGARQRPRLALGDVRELSSMAVGAQVRELHRDHLLGRRYVEVADDVQEHVVRAVVGSVEAKHIVALPLPDELLFADGEPLGQAGLAVQRGEDVALRIHMCEQRGATHTVCHTHVNKGV